MLRNLVLQLPMFAELWAEATMWAAEPLGGLSFVSSPVHHPPVTKLLVKLQLTASPPLDVHL